MSRFQEPEIVVMDGQKGLFAAGRTLWPNIPIQRCQFHVVAFTIQYVGRRPKEKPGKDLLNILYRIKDVKTIEQRNEWIEKLKGWERECEQFLISKDGNGQYLYPRLRSARYILRKALPNLFTFLNHPGVPNTTNLVEGWINSAIAEALRLHRGLRLKEKKMLVSIILEKLNKQNDNLELSEKTESLVL